MPPRSCKLPAGPERDSWGFGEWQHIIDGMDVFRLRVNWHVHSLEAGNVLSCRL